MLSTSRVQPFARLRRAEDRLPSRDVPEWLRLYRVYAFLTAAFVPLFGLAIDLSPTESFNPFWGRLLLAGLAMSVFGASYVSTWTVRRLNRLVYGTFALNSAWVVALAVRNQFAADYCVTLIFCVAAISLALSFVPSARLPLLCYQIVMTAVVTGAVLLAPEVETGRVVLVGCLAGVTFVTDVAATIRARLEEDRERYKNHLIAANERADEMLQLKAAFINNMNHEIRTPLTGIIGFAEIIGETAGHEQRAHAHVIQEAGRRLMDTLTGILDHAHLESGSFDVTLACVDVNTAVREAVTLLEHRAHRRDLALHVRCSGRPVLAHADHSAVTRIAYNLVSNALKFTEKGEIRVATYEERDAACLKVEDTGIGIEDQFLPFIFDEFKQASSGVNRSYEGTGIGLTVTKRLIELMDGTITIQTLPGAGSTFTVSLPRGRRDGRAPGAAPPSKTYAPPAVGAETGVS